MSLRTVTFHLPLAAAAIAAVSLVASAAHAQKKPAADDSDTTDTTPKRRDTKKQRDADADTKKPDADTKKHDADADADADAAAAAARRREAAKKQRDADADAAAGDDEPRVVVKKKPVKVAEKSDDDKTDHERMVGHLGFSWFGVSSLPLGFGTPAGTFNAPQVAGFTTQTVSAPAIGVRYWFSSVVGLDAGIGLGYSGGSTTFNTASTDKLGAFGMLIHAGVPLSIVAGKHISLQITPETNIGFTHASVAAPPPLTANSPPPASLGGVRFDLGARIGGEVQFGFIGIPELALEGSIGAFFTFQQATVSVGGASDTDSSIAITTANFHNPWDFFSSVIAARYYF